MMKPLDTLSRSRNMVCILDENNSPVARMRLFSEGVRTNNRMVQYEAVTGDRGCLACGNCLDICPVVREKRRFVFTGNQRTSMSLENIVGDECRRCYACVRSCPQVGKTVKEFALGFRRGEKVVHALSATLLFILAATGIFLFHYKEVVSSFQQAIFVSIHLTAGILFIGIPVLYFVLDRRHLIRAIRNSFRFDHSDLTWLKNFKKYISNPGKNPLPDWREFNTYHKFWFGYLSIMIIVMGATGISVFLRGNEVSILLGFHAFFALTIDLLVFIHLYFKILRRIYKDSVDLTHCYRVNRHLYYPFHYDPVHQKKKAYTTPWR